MAIKEGSSEERDLENLVDCSSLSEVIDALVRIAHGKAEHLASNWQDHTAAKSWDRDARQLDRVSPILEN